MKPPRSLLLFLVLLVFAGCGKKSGDDGENGVDSLVSADTVKEDAASDEYVYGEFTLPVKIVPGTNPAHNLDVQFLSKPLKRGEAAEGTEMDVTQLVCYEIGKIKSGKYAGERLFKVEKTYGDKDGDHFEVLRCTRKDDAIVYLPGLSSGYSTVGWVDLKAGVVRFSYEGKENSLMALDPFKNGASILIDSTATIDGFSAPNWLRIPKVPFSLKLQREITAGYDAAVLDMAFDDEKLGKVYTTKSKLNKDNYYKIDSGALNFSAVESCRGQDCLLKNGFYVFRPDQSALVYAFDLPSLDVSLERREGFKYKDYEGSTFRDCGGYRMDYACVVPNDAVQVEGDLEQIGSIFSGDAVYGLVNAEHIALKGLYEVVKKSWGEYDQFGADLGPLPNYREYLVSVPMFFWIDPFGRLIRFLNDRYLPPTACEPIIYVYSDMPEPVTVTLDKKVSVIKSHPEIGNGWKISTDQDGALFDLQGGKSHSRLFWEGVSDYLPRQNSGFVVEEGEIQSFLRKTLARLGLNDIETGEFLDAWLPKFDSAPYYRISFYAPAVIDYYAPLKIEPKPDTVIRVLMDFEPLENWESVPEPEFPSTPKRSGLTVVEWGGLKR